MKTFSVCILLLAAVAVQAAPRQNGPQWEVIPHSDGTLHMVDLATYEVDPEPNFDPVADIFFVLFTNSNPTVGQRVNIFDAASLAASNFNPANPTRFTIHGWGGSENSTPHEQMRNAYFMRGNFNCFTVDWAAGAQTINYITARNRVGVTGEVVGQFILWLESQAGMSLDSVLVLGHSLGAHAAGHTGKTTNGRINTIFGSDPAGPLFSVDSSDRLEDTDAQYVECIITNGGTLGHMSPLCQANFYPNGGSSQPGCGTDVGGTCAHERTNLFISESIRSTVSGFVSTRCASFDEILAGTCTPSGPNMAMAGEPSNHGRGANGVYTLATNAESPFALG
jgi:pancreatic triacylglycerol lipase